DATLLLSEGQGGALAAFQFKLAQESADGERLRAGGQEGNGCRVWHARDVLPATRTKKRGGPARSAKLCFRSALTPQFGVGAIVAKVFSSTDKVGPAHRNT